VRRARRHHAAAWRVNHLTPRAGGAGSTPVCRTRPATRRRRRNARCRGLATAGRGGVIGDVAGFAYLRRLDGRMHRPFLRVPHARNRSTCRRHFGAARGRCRRHGGWHARLPHVPGSQPTCEPWARKSWRGISVVGKDRADVALKIGGRRPSGSSTPPRSSLDPLAWTAGVARDKE
jgi:hypothetical protein